jgi:hypothetical protein
MSSSLKSTTRPPTDPEQGPSSYSWPRDTDVTFSDARDKNGLGGDFRYGAASAGDVGGSYSWGHYKGAHVDQVSFGVAGAGIGGAGGHSNTAVSGYLFNWCGDTFLGICNVGHAH